MPPTLALDSALLCSDIHLSDDRPQLTNAFTAWLSQQAKKAQPDAILILGDLFDAWVGDDATSATDSPMVNSVINCLAAISGRGITVGLMHGNRDFLIGESFARQCDATLLADPSVLAIAGGMRIAITHGDQLCTQDTDYQRFRQQVRSAAWQKEFLSRPLQERLAVAKGLRAQSEIEKGSKSMAIMDVTLSDAELLVDRLQADLLLHGHTHRPGCTSMPNGKLRWVLPDWDVDADGAVIRGGGLWADAEGVRPVT
ncbi:MAG: UDP-2,3-diacylglucosamine diphosphatase [Burkholderiaceae bacterium]|nr:UDP-2,3-diacylglucosamine diphosphatase [Burkholderiaceae bacterium]